MDNDAGTHRRWRHRASAVISLAVTAVMAVAIPALAHPVFSNDPPGFPNAQGSTASPYPGGLRPTVNMFLPFEQEGVIFNGAENTTVDVKVTIPAGWTSPACGNASTSTGYRQIGSVVPGWTCVIETVSGHQILHWRGPQINASQSFADSAQFFTYQVTVPSPATQTSYGATGGPEGFYVEQVYASIVDFSRWRTPNSTRSGEVANGIVRTVAGTTPRDPNLPKETPFVETHGGGIPPATKAPAPKAPGASLPGAGPTGPKPTTPPPQLSGGGPTPAPAGEPSPVGTPGGPSDGETQESPAPASTEPSPGIDAQSPSAKQLAQKRDEAAGQGAGWRVLVGIVLGLVLVAGAAIAWVLWRRRPS